MKKGSRVDAYITNSAEFAQPILSHFRNLVHECSPETSETIKWGSPCFEYKGMICSMASFKAHCNFSFWKGKELNDKHGVLIPVGNTAMMSFNKIKSINDLPEDSIIKDLIIQAIEQNKKEIPKIQKTKTSKELEMPKFILDALKTNTEIEKTFHNFSYSHKKEYIEWICEAKKEETKSKRVETMLEWLSEGKSRNWKYEKKK
ncbi:MAG: YdeI/OmpD-associated family protein [Flavobacteriales bacterium]